MEEQAKNIIQMFKPYVESEPFYSNKGGTIQKSIEYNAKQCAIIYCDGVIEALPLHDYKSMIHTRSEWEEIRSIIEKY